VGAHDLGRVLRSAAHRAQAGGPGEAVGEQGVAPRRARGEQVVAAGADQPVDGVTRQPRRLVVGAHDAAGGVEAQHGVGEGARVAHERCGAPARRWRAASKHRTVHAIPTLSDSLRPPIGTCTNPSRWSSTPSGRPLDSLPITSADPARSWSVYAAPRRATAPRRHRPAAANASSTCSGAPPTTSGTWNRAPADARTHLGL